jgi:gmma-aminobutyric acid receptor subunit gamma/cGMP-dependent protein kinase 2
MWQSIRKAKPRTVKSNDNSEFMEDINEYFAGIATDPLYDPAQITDIVNKHTVITQATGHHDMLIMTEYAVYQLLKKTKKTSPGPDGIPYWVYKNCAIELANVLTFLINQSLTSGVVPLTWKLAYVTPVLKPDKALNSCDFISYRPISVTGILCRAVEKLIVKTYLWPSMNTELMQDQFAFKPTGSTTAALLQIQHYVQTAFDQGNDYVRCLFIDYSKAFDTVSHPILLTELTNLNLPPSIFLWISDFLSGRQQAVKVNNKISKFVPINRSIVQGSVLGPYLYLVLVCKLKAKSDINKLFKYADDTTLLVPQHTDIDIFEEFHHLIEWSSENKLTINNNKTKEIIFFRTKNIAPKYAIQPITGIEQVSNVKLLGIHLDRYFSWSFHINSVLTTIHQRFYLLNNLKHMKLDITGLDIVFSSLIVSKINYAIQLYSGTILQSDKDKINAMFRKGKRWGITSNIFNFDELAVLADTGLLHSMLSGHHCLNHLIPEIKNSSTYNLRPKPTTYNLTITKHLGLENSFIHRCFNH